MAAIGVAATMVTVVLGLILRLVVNGTVQRAKSTHEIVLHLRDQLDALSADLKGINGGLGLTRVDVAQLQIRVSYLERGRE